MDNKLYIVAGLPGSGKTTVAWELAKQAFAKHVRSDGVRLEKFEDPTYSEWENEMVYSEMAMQAKEYLDSNPVVVDATFGNKRFRDWFLQYKNSELIKVEADDETVKKRLADRDDISEADFHVRELKRKQWDPIEVDHYVIDNSGSLSETKEKIARLLFPE